MRINLAFPLILLSLTTLVSCGSDGESPTTPGDVRGEYTLVSYRAESPPFVLRDEPSGYCPIVGGGPHNDYHYRRLGLGAMIHLRPGGNYEFDVYTRNTCSRPNGDTIQSEWTYQYPGTYIVEGSDIVLTQSPRDGRSSWVSYGKVQGRRLVFPEGIGTGQLSSDAIVFERR
jgi:hypothetical protein